MISSERAVLMVFGVILLVTSGSALRCWVCSSNVNTMCDDPMNTTDHSAAFHIRTCEQYPTGYGTSKPICRKIIKRDYGERIVIRQCSTPNHDESNIVDGSCGTSMIQAGRDVIESCHICSTDLCNSATSASAMQLLYAGALCLVYIFHSSKYCVF